MNDPSYTVLDSFALIAYFRNEASEPRVRAILQAGERRETLLAMTVVNQAEVYYKTIREGGVDEANFVLSQMSLLNIDVFGVDRDLAFAAARIKGEYRLSYADCLAAALAKGLEATLVTGDPEFRQIEHLIDIEWLPAGA